MSAKEFFIDWASDTIARMIQSASLRNLALPYAEKEICRNTVENTSTQFPSKIRAEEYLAFRNMLYGFHRALGNRAISLPARKALGDEKYHRDLTAYGYEVEDLTREIWEKDYLGR